MAGLLGCEEQSQVRYFLRLAVSLIRIGSREDLHSLFLGHIFAKSLLLELGHHRCVDRAGADAVDMDTEFGYFQGGAFCKTKCGVLTGHISAHRGRTGDGALGGDVDDRAALLLLHLRQRVLHAIERSEHVDAVDLHHIFDGLRVNRQAESFIAGVVDLHIQCAEVLDGLFNHVFDLLFIGNIDNKGQQILRSNLNLGKQRVHLLLTGG